MNPFSSKKLTDFISSAVTIAFSVGCGVAFSKADENSFFLIPANAEWHYRAQAKGPSPNWQLPSFDHSRWKSGKAGFGYGYEGNRTHFKHMRDRFASVQLRRTFAVNRLTANRTLYLYVRYDDAFVAYINGHEVASAGIVEHRGKREVEDHEADGFEVFTIDNAAKILRGGKNVLAIEGYNRTLDSSDFILQPVLTTEPVKNPQLPAFLNQQQMLADLQQFQRRMQSDSSYLLATQLNLHESIQPLLHSHKQVIDSLQFARELQKVIAKIGDAHANVDVNLDANDDRNLPFIIADSSAGIIAIDADNKELLDKDHPILVSIDGKPTKQWLTVAAAYVPHASPQLVRHQSLRELRSIDRMRTELGVDRPDNIDITLQSLDGERRVQRQLQTLNTRLPSGKVALGESRLLPGNIGYLRIPSMRSSGTDAVLSQMARFKSTEGLIIDVRGNSGGRYEILEELYGYFMPEGAPPYVTNIAAYRLSPRFDTDHLSYRPTFRLTHSGWSKEERRAIDKAFAQFQPEWQIPNQKFSTWHFMLLGKSDDPQQYTYQQAVVVLCNAASFSATDGFLSAFADLPNATLIGQASAGGSGATQDFTLKNSGIEIAISSMASFRPNGKLFDGNGIDVDVRVAPTPADFLGRSDTALEKSVAWIQKSGLEND